MRSRSMYVLGWPLAAVLGETLAISRLSEHPHLEGIHGGLPTCRVRHMRSTALKNSHLGSSNCPSLRSQQRLLLYTVVGKALGCFFFDPHASKPYVADTAE